MPKARARIFTGGVMTGTTVLTSEVVDLSDRALCAAQLVWTSTAVGTFSFEGSCNYQKLGADATATGDWTAFSLAVPVSNPAGVARSVLADLSDVPWDHVRIKYTNASSTGVLDGYVTGRNK